MGRCGCASVAASGAAIEQGQCIGATGAGTPSSPFLLAPRVDPAAGNLLSCGPGGLKVPDPDYPGQWTGYEPLWTSATPPVVGNAQIGGFYRKRGRSMEVTVAIIMGTLTAAGLGAWYIGLPPGYTAAYPCVISGFAIEYGSGGTIVRAGPLTALFGAGANAVPVWFGGRSDFGGGWAGGDLPSDGWYAGSQVYLTGVVFVGQ